MNSVTGNILLADPVPTLRAMNLKSTLRGINFIVKKIRKGIKNNFIVVLMSAPVL